MSNAVVNFDHISDWFWDIISRAAENRNTLREILLAMDKADILRFQEQFVDAAVELQDEPFTDYMEESEDGIEDISHWVVSRGKTFYADIVEHPEKIPRTVTGNTDVILYGIADEVCVDKFGESTGIY
ncbi:DUF4240 domain-containing protein [Chitinophaga qingshengii]|uniref:DUF4240 domain-containing protein n=1 Tax=Chitinophaga qingshengii TaxID=1569794 RepID=A0ABR7TSY2_9BACT|nr:DUF4240 domain-containing protein [Chitinophaga qingshengii]MBC9932770.1 DUF4240 domain-containing protein [Chitinophaga qingshengii]